MSTSIEQFHSEHAGHDGADPGRHTASPETVGDSVVAWFSGARIDLSRPAVFAVTLVGAFALGMILVTIGMALLSATR